MNHEKNRELDDMQMEQALRNFRSSMRAWSEEEFAKPRTVRRSRWNAVWMGITSPAASWALAVVVLGSSIGIPVSVHHERQVAEQRQALEHQKELEAKAAQERAAQAVDDAVLLSDVDSDIAQAAPEAMQPLASMMGDSGSLETQK